MRAALVIGINEYPENNHLNGCVNDANDIEEMLVTNGDSSHNFDVKKITDSKATQPAILKAIKELFNKDCDIALLYFSGHGCDNANDGSIISVDLKAISFRSIMEVVHDSKAKYKVVILDCCYSGKMGQYSQIGDMTVLSDNTVILTACSPKEPAVDDGLSKHGTFTKLLLGALKGGASDILGRITAGSIYSYIDQALGAWEQRPYFKANVSSFAPIRTINPKISLCDLKTGLNLFVSEDSKYRLDPSYEDTNFKGNHDHRAKRPYANDGHVELMKILQKMNQNGLVKPTVKNFMYDAAMNSSSVELTDLGKHYWGLCKTKREFLK